jgi:hypothetical protein
MPPTFVYLMCLILWVACASLVWFTAGLMFLWRKTRSLAKPLFLAMAGTFPFVFAYQIVVAPIVAVVLLLGWSFWKILEPGASTTTENPLVIVVSIGTLLLSFAAMILASLTGFYEGWRAGWAYGKGRILREVLSQSPGCRILQRGVDLGRALLRRDASYKG